MGKYLKLFNNHSLYNAYLTSESFIRPNVSHCITEDEVHYNPLSVFMFLSSDKKLVEIPYTEGMTSDVFQQYLPSHLFYGGYVATPINSVNIEGKTMNEVDTMLGEVTRASLAKKSNELVIGMVYKVYTFPKSVYLNNAKMVTTTGNQSLFHILTCIPSNLFRSGSIVIDNGDTPIYGAFATTYTVVNRDGSTIIYTPSSLFGVEDAYFVVVDVISTVEDGEHHTIKGSYTTYDNVTVITDNPIWDGQV